MSEIWKPHPIEVYKDWTESILIEASDRLNDWESIFVENIDKQLERNFQLSQLQAEKLEQIYTKHTK